MSFPSTMTRRCLALSTSEIFSIPSPTRDKATRTPNLRGRKSLNFQESTPEPGNIEVEGVEKVENVEAMRGLEITRTASRRCRISSFEKGKSCGSFPVVRQHH